MTVLFSDVCKQDIETYYKFHVNPFDMGKNDYILFFETGVYIVCAGNLQEALEFFGDYCNDNELEYISSEQKSEEDFPVNEGEFWLQMPYNFEKIKGRFKYDYSVSFEEWTKESSQHGDVNRTGFHIQNAQGNLHEIQLEARRYGATEAEGFGWLYANDSVVLDGEIPEEGEDTFYAVHIKGQDHIKNEVLNAISKEINKVNIDLDRICSMRM